MAAYSLKAQSLKDDMDAVGVASFKALALQSGVSRRQIEWLRRGQVSRLSVQSALKLATTLQLSLSELLHRFEDNLSSSLESATLSATLSAPLEDSAEGSQPMTVPFADYQRLEQALAHQKAQLLENFQSEALNILESLLIQWPTAAHAAQKNPTLPAIRLIPLLKPLEQLFQTWDVEAIATVSEIIPYEPTLHQWSGETAPPAVQSPVQVSHVGYRQRERLLYRAKVRLPKSDAGLSV
jgi:transcriptional regulator with XRE-family HTH domain